jgi:uncharacterized protein involved in exopolysaccharide biosynthesis
MQPPPPTAADPAGEVRLRELAALARRRWRTVAVCTLAPVVLAAGALAARPARWLARTVMVPWPPAGAPAPAPGVPRSLPVELAGADDPGTRLLDAVLKSQALRDTVAARVAGGDALARARARRVLDRHAVLRYQKTDNSIIVEVRAPGAELAERLANAVPGALNDIAVRLHARGARDRERYLRTRLAAARQELAHAERRLRDARRGGDTVPPARQQAEAAQAHAALSAALARTVADAEHRGAALSVLDRAARPARPEPEPWVQVLLPALLAGLVTGLLAAALAEHLRPRHADRP